MKTKIMKPVLAILFISLCAAGSHGPIEGPGVKGEVADTIVTNGKIYTLNPDQLWAEAVAIKNGKFTYVGSSAGVKRYQSEQTKTIDLGGKLHYLPEVLAKLVTQLDQLGYTIKVHTAGDRAVRVTLDAIEHARKVNGDSGLRHELAHAGFIDDKDLPRFASLNAVADVSPHLWFPSPIIDSIVSAMGERGLRYWPIKSLIDSGAQVTVGSDWPAAVPDMNPWGGLEAMVSRKHPNGEHPGVFWEEQAITLEQALYIYTISGAKASKIDTIAGSIETGKFADVIVLDQHLFEIPVEKISDTKVEMTLFEGRIVYQKGVLQ